MTSDIKRYVDAGEDVGAIFRHLAVHDIQLAADALKPVYDRTKAADGYHLDGGLALSGQGHRRHDGRGAVAVVGNHAAQSDDQGAGHEGRVCPPSAI